MAINHCHCLLMDVCNNPRFSHKLNKWVHSQIDGDRLTAAEACMWLIPGSSCLKKKNMPVVLFNWEQLSPLGNSSPTSSYSQKQASLHQGSRAASALDTHFITFFPSKHRPCVVYFLPQKMFIKVKDFSRCSVWGGLQLLSKLSVAPRGSDLVFFRI